MQECTVMTLRHSDARGPSFGPFVHVGTFCGARHRTQRADSDGVASSQLVGLLHVDMRVATSTADTVKMSCVMLFFWDLISSNEHESGRQARMVQDRPNTTRNAFNRSDLVAGFAVGRPIGPASAGQVGEAMNGTLQCKPSKKHTHFPDERKVVTKPRKQQHAWIAPFVAGALNTSSTICVVRPRHVSTSTLRVR